MDHSSQGRRWRTRPILLGALVVALLATFALAPAQAQTRVGAMLQTLTSWLWPTRWVWPLAAVLTLAALNTSQARRRWPRPSHRVLPGISMLVGLIGLASLATMRRPLMGLLALGVVVALGLLANWVLVVLRQVAPRVPADVLEHLDDNHRARLEVADARIKLQNDLRTTALGAIAGLAVLAGAVLGFQQLTEDRQQATATRQLTLQGQASERFTRTIDQLGSDRQEVQLGGIYGLEQIAQQAPANRLAVTEVLVAYLRRRSPVPVKSPPRGPDRFVRELRVRAADVQAALTVLGRRQSAPDDPPLNLVALDLRSADLRRADLRRANLNFADLRRANLNAAVLSGADLSEADLLAADLRAVDFRRAFFYSAIPRASATSTSATPTSAAPSCAVPSCAARSFAA